MVKKKNDKMLLRDFTQLAYTYAEDLSLAAVKQLYAWWDPNKMSADEYIMAHLPTQGNVSIESVCKTGDTKILKRAMNCLLMHKVKVFNTVIGPCVDANGAALLEMILNAEPIRPYFENMCEQFFVPNNRFSYERFLHFAHPYVIEVFDHPLTPKYVYYFTGTYDDKVRCVQRWIAYEARACSMDA